MTTHGKERGGKKKKRMWQFTVFRKIQKSKYGPTSPRHLRMRVMRCDTRKEEAPRADEARVSKATEAACVRAPGNQPASEEGGGEWGV